MARNAPGTAMGDFFIIVGSASYLDARPGSPGYAAFGHVVSGMPLVKRILAMPTHPGGFSKETMGQIDPPAGEDHQRAAGEVRRCAVASVVGGGRRAGLKGAA